MSAHAEQVRSWPLPHDLTAARAARGHVAEFLGDRDVAAEAADAVTLVASELAVNAIRHGEGDAHLRLQTTEAGIRISVVGTSAGGDPTPGAADELATSGRGLAIVASLAQDWGWAREGDQVTVWAVV